MVAMFVLDAVLMVGIVGAIVGWLSWAIRREPKMIARQAGMHRRVAGGRAVSNRRIPVGV